MLALLNPTSFVASSGYVAIFILSVLQSCCVPTSSELTLGFAGVLAVEGKLSLTGAIAAGAAGEVVGASSPGSSAGPAGGPSSTAMGATSCSPTATSTAPRPGTSATTAGVFGSRLLPVIRNFVALPAGVAEVPLVRFASADRRSGRFIWDGAMALIGYEVGSSWQSVMHGFSDAGYLLGALAVLAIAVFLVHRYRSYKAATAAGATTPGPR